MKKLFQLGVLAIFLITGSLVYSQQTQTQPQTSRDPHNSLLMKAAKKERERREKTKERRKTGQIIYEPGY